MEYLFSTTYLSIIKIGNLITKWTSAECLMVQNTNVANVQWSMFSVHSLVLIGQQQVFTYVKNNNNIIYHCIINYHLSDQMVLTWYDGGLNPP